MNRATATNMNVPANHTHIVTAEGVVLWGSGDTERTAREDAAEYIRGQFGDDILRRVQDEWPISYTDEGAEIDPATDSDYPQTTSDLDYDTLLAGCWVEEIE